MVDVVRLVDLIQMMLVLHVTHAFIVASTLSTYGKNDATDFGRAKDVSVATGKNCCQTCWRVLTWMYFTLLYQLEFTLNSS